MGVAVRPWALFKKVSMYSSFKHGAFGQEVVRDKGPWFL
jgi:hypothetical protein